MSIVFQGIQFRRPPSPELTDFCTQKSGSVPTPTKVAFGKRIGMKSEKPKLSAPVPAPQETIADQILMQLDRVHVRKARY
ncbi:hypothetical protein C4J81_15885 [Deltaproteobacteria bacterium Smac51]|nr:hypothetical protein C4J81_15885 [Deltaproteobacteria bacterium Smac51]